MSHSHESEHDHADDGEHDLAHDPSTSMTAVWRNMCDSR